MEGLRVWSRAWYARFMQPPTIPSAAPACAEEQCSFIGQTFYSWLDPIVATGFRRPIAENDVPLRQYNRCTQSLQRMGRSGS